jgi:hypothetical protein
VSYYTCYEDFTSVTQEDYGHHSYLSEINSGTYTAFRKKAIIGYEDSVYTCNIVEPWKSHSQVFSSRSIDPFYWITDTLTFPTSVYDNL